MGKRIVWTDRASEDLNDILDYWNHRTGSKSYSLKLFKGFKDLLKVIADFPAIGQHIENRDERFFLKESYMVIYLDLPETLYVMKIWDTRRNPDDLQL